MRHAMTQSTNPLREARIRARLKKPALAAIADVSVSTIIRAERGQSISEISQQSLAEALGFEHRRELFPEPEEATA